MKSSPSYSGVEQNTDSCLCAFEKTTLCRRIDEMLDDKTFVLRTESYHMVEKESYGDTCNAVKPLVKKELTRETIFNLFPSTV